jgi:GNAT superfamily N-acetyltransferase
MTDAASLKACIDAAYLKYVQHIADLPPVSEGCADDIAMNQVWVSTQADIVIAGMILIPSNGFLKLANLAVHPDHAGKGIGRAMLELADQEAKQQGFSEMQLSTHTQMPENVQMYQHMGWKEIDRQGNTVSMRKILG